VTPVLEAVGLDCVRGSRYLFRGLSFELAAGEMLWVQGPNGSGKTSLLRLLCGLLRPEAGTVRWKGADVRAGRESFYADLLYAGHAAGIKDDLTGPENVRYSLAHAGVGASSDDAASALKAFGLDGRGQMPSRWLSQGQKRRVGLARLALASDKSLWVLDEPFTALDAQAVQLVQAMLAQHLSRDGIVVFTSHQEVDVSEVRVKRLQLNG
jgi:heme exporter protein A